MTTCRKCGGEIRPTGDRGLGGYGHVLHLTRGHLARPTARAGPDVTAHPGVGTSGPARAAEGTSGRLPPSRGAALGPSRPTNPGGLR